MTANVIWSNSLHRRPYISRVLDGVKMLKSTLIGLFIFSLAAYFIVFHTLIAGGLAIAFIVLGCSYLLGEMIILAWQEKQGR